MRATQLTFSLFSQKVVIADLVSAIHKHRDAGRVWMAGTGPAMTVFDWKDG
jgi:hypothetical protein